MDGKCRGSPARAMGDDAVSTKYPSRPVSRLARARDGRRQSPRRRGRLDMSRLARARDGRLWDWLEDPGVKGRGSPARAMGDFKPEYHKSLKLSRLAARAMGDRWQGAPAGSGRILCRRARGARQLTASVWPSIGVAGKGTTHQGSPVQQPVAGYPAELPFRKSFDCDFKHVQKIITAQRIVQ